MMLSLGVTYADAAPGPKETCEGEEETQEIPPGLEEWAREAPI